jgi:DNA mismatch repair protein MutS
MNGASIQHLLFAGPSPEFGYDPPPARPPPMRSTYLDKDGPPRSSGAQSPMMDQFWRAKREAPDALLFFRMGDFYELFHEDAKIAARELGLTLTSRSKGEDAIAMAGVPWRNADAYLVRLVKKGFKVAICEQMQDPREAKGLVERAVVRIVTPGTLTEENALDAREHNWLLCIAVAGEVAGLAWADVSTGRLCVADAPLAKLVDEVARIAPAEILVAPRFDEAAGAAAAELRATHGVRMGEREAWHYDRESARRILHARLKVHSLEGFGLDEEQAVCVGAAGALLSYLEETQKNACAHLSGLEHVQGARHLVLDRATRSCLELFRTQRDGAREGSLIEVLDATLTPMGGRLLHEWLASPLREVEPILLRQRAVAEFHGSPFLREDARAALGPVLDIERLAAKVATLRANARDLVALANSLAQARLLKDRLAQCNATLLADLVGRVDPLEELVEHLRSTLVDAPPMALKDGGLVRAGVDAELDELRAIAGDAKSWMARFQSEEIEKSGMPGLKVGFNSVFGYFIEVPRGQVERVPASYIRKQTVKNAERYITPELKEMEDKVLHAEERAKDLEFRLFERLRDEAGRELERILRTAAAVAEIDVLAALAQRAAEHRYCAPVVDDGDTIRVIDGRHPVVERNPRAESFVPNDAKLNRSDRLVTIITGPNMAGKSTYIRQVALIVILAQIGSFVPAAEARVGVVDRVFTRIGAADDIARNASTFMVEMLEIANILNNATPRSLVVLDEVGRGTSTFDGLALAWAIVEHLHESIRARSLFATHYHQLVDLADRHKGVCNMHVAVREWNDEIVFLHKLVEGGTDRSWGIHVARLAGVPRPVLERAKQVLSDVEKDAEDLAPRLARGAKAKKDDAQQLSLFAPRPSEVESEIKALDLDRVTPIEALMLLRELRSKLS